MQRFTEFLANSRYPTGLALLIAVVLIGFFHSPLVIGVALSVVFAVALYESLTLFGLKQIVWLYPAALLFWLAALFYPKPFELLFAALIIAASIVAYNQKHNLSIALPLLYPTAPLLFLYSLYIEYGISALAVLLVIVALCDIGAYYTGKKLGKNSFSPSSPNKTIEGVAGGITAGAIFGTIAAFSLLPIGFGAAFLIALAAAFASVFGDLFESFLKRQAGVKDSGKILPGHGGMLDRIDGYLFAGVVMLMGLHIAI